MSTKNNPTIAEKTAKLNELVAWFDTEDFELERALDVFSQAEKLAQEIEHDLQALKNNIEIVKAKFSETE
jgi:exodeoxyribonuclease VII small subunit